MASVEDHLTMVGVVARDTPKAGKRVGSGASKVARDPKPHLTRVVGEMGRAMLRIGGYSTLLLNLINRGAKE